MSAGTASPYAPIVCACGQLLAKRWPSGYLRVVVVWDQAVDDRGRYLIDCPQCDNRVAVSPARRRVP